MSKSTATCVAEMLKCGPAGMRDGGNVKCQTLKTQCAWLVELYHLAPPPFLDHISRSAKLPITWEDASGEELDDRGDERPALSLLAVTSGEEDAVEQRLLARLGYAPFEDEAEDLKRHGVSVVHRWPARAKRALEELAYPRIVAQQPAQSAASDCAQGGTVKAYRNSPRNVLYRVLNATVTFEGITLTQTGAMLARDSWQVNQGKHWLRDLLTAPKSFRVTPSCPRAPGLHRFCVRAARAPQVELTLRSLALGVTTPPPQYLHDEVSLYRERALACTRPKLRKHAAGDGPTVDRLLVFQHADANNYYHFFAQSLPRLLLLLDDELVAAVPEVADAKIFASVARPFATATFEALGISDRIVEYDPCTTVHADEVLAVVEVVRRPNHVHEFDSTKPVADRTIDSWTFDWTPSAADAGRARAFLGGLAAPPRPVPALSGGVFHRLGGALTVPLAVILDRADVDPQRDSRPASGLPTLGQRTIVNAAALREVAFDALAEHGFELQTLQAANLPLAEQAALFARTTLLIGAHGAGLTNLLAMPDGGAVLELVPAKRGASALGMGPDAEPLSARCGLTTLWQLAAARGGLHYHAMILNDHGNGDALEIDEVIFEQNVAAIARGIVRERQPKQEL